MWRGPTEWYRTCAGPRNPSPNRTAVSVPNASGSSPSAICSNCCTDRPRASTRTASALTCVANDGTNLRRCGPTLMSVGPHRIRKLQARIGTGIQQRRGDRDVPPHRGHHQRGVPIFVPLVHVRPVRQQLRHYPQPTLLACCRRCVGLARRVRRSAQRDPIALKTRNPAISLQH